MGRGGRGSVGRAGMFAGRFSVSDRQRVDDGAKTPLPELRPVANGWSDGLVKAAAYGKSVWFWHPWLVSSWRRFSLTQPGSAKPSIRRRWRQEEFVSRESAP